MPQLSAFSPKTVALSLLLSACMLGGGAAAQATQGASASPTNAAPANAAPTSATPAAATSTASQDLTLEAALLQLSQAPSVTQSRLTVQVAQTNLDAARTSMGLTVSVNGSATSVGSYTGPSTTEGTRTYPSTFGGVAGATVSLGILPWSTNQYTLRSAQRNLSLAEALLVDAENSGRLNVIQQYYAAVSAQLAVTQAQQSVAVQQRALNVAQAQQSLQNATAESVLTAQANLQTVQAQLAQAQGSLQTAKLSLGAALGRDMTRYNFVTAAPTTFETPDVSALVASARETRSDVVDARKKLGDAQDQLEQDQRDATLPTLTTGVNYGPTSNAGLSASLDLKAGTLSGSYNAPWGDGTSSNSNHLTASVNGSYVVYSPSRRAELAADRANVTQYQLTLSVAQQNVELDVRTKYNAFQNALLAIQAQETQVREAQTALATAQSRLSVGLSTQDDVNEAQLKLVQAQNTLQTDRITAYVALTQLKNAAGGQP